MLLPTDKVRHVGEAVVMVLAQNANRAQDAAEAVQITYDELAPVTDSEAALTPNAAAIWGDLPNNVLVDTVFGDAAATAKAFASADHVVKVEFDIGRVTAVPMEPRAALASYDPATDRYTLYAGSGGAVRQKHELAAVLGVAPERLRVLSYDVGGNFGSRNRVYVEFGLVLWAARMSGRPVKYTASRSEAFLTDYQGRDLKTKVELALRADGRFLAMRADNISNVGACCVSLSPLGKGAALITGSYHIPAATLRARAVFTNTMPTNAYRSDRARDRSRRRRAEARPRRAAAPKPRGAAGDALHQRGRRDLRQRHLRDQYGPRHAHRRLGRRRCAPPRRQSAGPAAWARACQLCRVLDWSPARAHGNNRHRRRQRRCDHWHTAQWSGA
jgi:CO/xanthine dehydrogenase Mo-binding subunit